MGINKTRSVDDEPSVKRRVPSSRETDGTVRSSARSADAGRAASAFQIRLLGRFEITRGGRVIADRGWHRRKARALIALLALSEQRELRSSEIRRHLWPALSESAASNNLYKALHHVRSELPGPAIVDSAEPFVRLKPCTVDTVEFRRAAAASFVGAPNRAACERALALYGGPLLPEAHDEGWLAPIRNGLRAYHERVVLQLAALEERDGDHGRAEVRLLDLLQADQANEQAHRQLIELYIATGRHDRALRQYLSCVDDLRSELGIAPSAATTRLYRHIVAESDTPARRSRRAK
jgi:DNA-binding SARP family transcriptional activator